MAGPSSDLQQHAKASNDADWVRVVGCVSKRVHRDEVPNALKVVGGGRLLGDQDWIDIGHP